MKISPFKFNCLFPFHYIIDFFVHQFGEGGRGEDPHNRKEGTSNVDELRYRIMEATAFFAHSHNMKSLWAPYSVKAQEWINIGEIVNSATHEVNGDIRNVLDILIMQPGLFFSENDKDIDAIYRDEEFNDADNQYDKLEKQIKLKNSVEAGAFVDINGELILPTTWGNNTESSTKTEIVVQIEYDISLVTGRVERASLGSVPQLPMSIAKNFVRTYEHYKSIIYSEDKSIGIYAGGPGEQDYANIHNDFDELVPNNNTHTVINHASGLGTFVESSNGANVWIDPCQGMAFDSFFSRLLNNNAEAYNVGWYGNTLIYDITKGLLTKEWSDDIKQYLNMPEDI